MRECENCDFISDHPAAFQKHLNSIRTCSYCSKVFCGKRALKQIQRHEKKEHIIIVKVKPKCTNCDKEFGKKSKLKQHLVWSKCGRKNDQLIQM